MQKYKLNKEYGSTYSDSSRGSRQSLTLLGD